MREARDRALARVAAQIRACLLTARRKRRDDWGDVPYRELEAKYQLTGEGYHTWPFQPSAVSGVSITAGLTLLGNVAAILYRMYVSFREPACRPWELWVRLLANRADYRLPVAGGTFIRDALRKVGPSQFGDARSASRSLAPPR